MFNDWKTCQRCNVKRPPRSLKFEFDEEDGREIITCASREYCDKMKRAVERGVLRSDTPENPEPT